MKTRYTVTNFKNSDMEGVKEIYDFHNNNPDVEIGFDWKTLQHETYMYAQNISVAFEEDKRERIVGFGISKIREDKCELHKAYCINGLDAAEEAEIISQLKKKSLASYKKPPSEAEAQATLIQNLKKEKEQGRKEKTSSKTKTFPDRYRFGSL